MRVPVLAIAGRGDGIAPVAACHHVGELLAGAPSVRLETAPGGHLGVLTGRAARGTTWVALDRFLAEHERRLRAARPPRRAGRLSGGAPATLADATGAHHPHPHRLDVGAPRARRDRAGPAPPEERIRAGVTVSGVDVGNLTVAEATARLEQTLGPVLAQDVAVTAAGRSFPLKMARAEVQVPRRQDRAARALRRPGRAARAGRLAAARVGDAVGRLQAQAGLALRPRGPPAKVDVAARDARIRIKTYRISKVPGRKGRKLAVKRARRGDPGDGRRPAAAARARAGTMSRSTPRIRTKELAKAYPTVITIDQSSFRLRLFKRLKFVKGYGVAVGQAGVPDAERPASRSRASRSTRPGRRRTRPGRGRWAASRSPAARPNNPLKARWMGVSGAVGIHGTGQPWSIGTRASHGCIRMTVPDVIDLFDRVSVGTPVLIAP